MPKLGILNKNVAIKLIIGHIIQQIQIDIAYVIIWGLSCGVTTLNARILAYFPTIKKILKQMLLVKLWVVLLMQVKKFY